MQPSVSAAPCARPDCKMKLPRRGRLSGPRVPPPPAPPVISGRVVHLKVGDAGSLGDSTIFRSSDLGIKLTVEDEFGNRAFLPKWFFIACDQVSALQR
jgi:hypothetical protein